MASTDIQVMQSIPENVELFLKAMEELRKMLEVYVKNHKDAKAQKEMANYIKNGGNVKTFIARDFSEKDFIEELNRMGCTCVTARITQGPCKGLIACMVKEDDLPKALIAREKALSHGTQIADEFGNIYSPTTEMSVISLQAQITQDKAQCITTESMCDSKTKFMVEQLRSQNIPFSRIESTKEITAENGESTEVPMTSFLVSSRDRERVAQCLARTEIEFSGISGNYRNQSMKSEQYKMEQAKSYIDSTSSKEEFYVVSATNPLNAIHVEAHKVTHEINGTDGKTKSYRAVDGLYDHADMQKVFKQEVDSLKSPLLFTEEEYHQGMANPELMKELIRKKADYPQYRNEMDKMNCIMERQMKRLLNQKLYYAIAKGTFDLEMEREELDNVRQHGFPLDAYLNPSSADDVEFLANLSGEDRKMVEDMLNDYLGCFETADQQLQLHTITEQERVSSLDDLLLDAKNSMDYSIDMDQQNLELE